MLLILGKKPIFSFHILLNSYMQIKDSLFKNVKIPRPHLLKSKNISTN
jgi:hypothetical protein